MAAGVCKWVGLGAWSCGNHSLCPVLHRSHLDQLNVQRSLLDGNDEGELAGRALGIAISPMAEQLLWRQ